MNWYELDFWNSNEWEVICERLEDEEYCPGPESLFYSMDVTPLEEVRCVIMGQDPYPNPSLAMGLAFSVPNIVRQAIPPSLRIIFHELVNDVHCPFPTTTDLTPWARQGVFLWNAVPTCRYWESMSHDWEEWSRLTMEIVRRLNERGCVFVFVGSVARRFAHQVDNRSEFLATAHPSPRGSFNDKPFRGNRLFSWINDTLGQNPIDWRLP